MYFDHHELLDFPILLFFILSYFIICAIFYSLDAGFLQYYQGVKQFGPDQAGHFVGPAGSRLFAKVISRQQKWPIACKE